MSDPNDKPVTSDIFDSITEAQWLSVSTLAVGNASFGPQGLTIGSFVFAAGAQLKLDGDRLTVVRDGWRVEAFIKYRPLIYYAAYGSDEVFACLRIAVGSLFEFGGYDGDVLILTDPAHLSWPECLPDAIRPRVRMVQLAAADMLDWTLARYRVIQVPGLERYRPFLYLDMDVVSNGPIGPLLRMLAVSTALQAVAENALMRPENWYGASLLTADGVAVSPDRLGFSTGVLGFPDLATIRGFFAQVPLLAEGYAAQAGQRDQFDCYDQPFANYLAVKTGGYGLGLIERFLDNRHFWLRGDPTRLGLAHFTGGTGVARSKLPAMTAYLDTLRNGPALSQSHTPDLPGGD